MPRFMTMPMTLYKHQFVCKTSSVIWRPGLVVPGTETSNQSEVIIRFRSDHRSIWQLWYLQKDILQEFGPFKICCSWWSMIWPASITCKKIWGLPYKHYIWYKYPCLSYQVWRQQSLWSKKALHSMTLNWNTVIKISWLGSLELCPL